MIVDASVALKWIVKEADGDLALALMNADILAAPDLIFSEVANAIWKKWRRGELSGVPLRAALLVRTLTWVEPTSGLMLRAASLAQELDHPAYDCFYLALALDRQDFVVTADERFIKAVAATQHAGSVRHLRDAGT